MNFIGGNIIFIHEGHEVVRRQFIDRHPDHQDNDADNRYDIYQEQFPEQSLFHGRLPRLLVGEPVTETAHGLDISRVCRIRFYLLPELADMHINNPVNNHLAVLVEMIQEF